MSRNQAESDDGFRALVEQAPDLIARFAPDGTFSYASPAYEHVLGCRPEELVGTQGLALLHPDDRDETLRRLRFAIETEDSFTLSYRVRHADGSYRWLEALHRVVREPESRAAVEIQMIARDITDRRREHDVQRRFLALAHDIFCIVGPDGIVRWTSRLFERQLGWTAAEIATQRLRMFVHPDDRERVVAELERLDRDGRPLTLEHRFRCKGGSYRWVSWQVTHDQDSGCNYCAARDVTREHEIEQRLVHQAYHDPLTGLPNRTLFLTCLYDALMRTEEQGSTLAVVLLDVDGFKLVNDSLGHVSGDALLTAIGRRLATELGPSDVLARFGGDEFMLLVERAAGDEDVLALVARVQEALASAFTLGGRQHYVTVSAGITRAGYATTPERLLQEADAALSQAKASGRGRAVVFEPEMRARAETQLRMEADLRAALERQQLQLHYQPLVDLRSGVVDGVEALARWDHRLHRFVPPMQFIPLAEEVGLIVPLGAWVLAEACSQVTTWRLTARRQAPLRVCVNISARQLHGDLVASVREALAVCAIEPSLLELELTESVIMQDPAAAIEILQALKRLGVRLAIDDFGTGYASLSYLARLPVDVLKIDRSFVVAAGHDANAATIVRAVVALAHSLGLEVTAEGIETRAQLDYVRETGCDRGQGYLLGRPAPLDQLNLQRKRRVRPMRRAA
jgi:diguanylate cyclase (GGDEF)-like protein/PAS domain S-box-containing protein